MRMVVRNDTDALAMLVVEEPNPPRYSSALVDLRCLEMKDAVADSLPRTMISLELRGCVTDIASFLNRLEVSVDLVELHFDRLTEAAHQLIHNLAKVQNVGLVLIGRDMEELDIDILVGVLPCLHKLVFADAGIQSKVTTDRIIQAIQDRPTILPILSMDTGYDPSIFYNSIASYIPNLKVKSYHGGRRKREMFGLSQNPLSIEHYFLQVSTGSVEFALIGKMLESNTTLQSLYIGHVPLFNEENIFHKQTLTESKKLWKSLSINTTLKKLTISGLGAKALDTMIDYIPSWKGLLELNLEDNLKRPLTDARREYMRLAQQKNPTILEIKLPAK